MKAQSILCNAFGLLLWFLNIASQFLYKTLNKVNVVEIKIIWLKAKKQAVF
jgi:hypothetical protein